MKNDNYRGDDNDDGDDDDDDRLLAVPFWIVESAREIAERKSRNLERTHRGGPALLVFFLLAPISRALSTIQKGPAGSLMTKTTTMMMMMTRTL